jgi:hypothetical protein
VRHFSAAKSELIQILKLKRGSTERAFVASEEHTHYISFGRLFEKISNKKIR